MFQRKKTGTKRRRSAKKAHASKRRRKRKTSLEQMSWQIVGLITIIVILMTVAWGDSIHTIGIAKDNFFDKPFSETVASFEISSSLLQ